MYIRIMSDFECRYVYRNIFIQSATLDLRIAI